MLMSLDEENTNKEINFDEKESSGENEFQEVFLQQSVTMMAYMDRTTHNATLSTGISKPMIILGFSFHDLPILIGGVIGAAGLILIILIAVIVWHCCQVKVTHDKAYCLDNSSQDDSFLKQNGNSIVHSDSVAFMGLKNNHVATRAIGKSHTVFHSSFPHSQSFQDKKELTVSVEAKKICKKRPTSQPIAVSNFLTPLYSSKQAQSIHSHYYQNYMDNSVETNGISGLPSIPEVVLVTSESHCDGPPLSLYASCNALNGPYSYNSSYSTLDSNGTLKTRSLPTWGRTHPRPLSTEDDLNELYAKVSFSKKRKNRMHSDSAAAIAANRSKNTHMILPYIHKDTDSLVDNEAVVVYDERTAL